MSPLVICLFVISAVGANILMPHNFFNTRSQEPPMEQEVDIAMNSEPRAVPAESSNNYQQDHARNCFFTPVQCMLPLTDSHKDVQSLHGVYSPTATHVRRSVDSMLTSPWGYTDLIKRGDDNQFYQWLRQF
uniref:Uncharacterized protein n=1 Tax=Caenorhabditis japonica TaxID=281687 RepID=A0A8R1DY45_CAEJA